MFIVQSGPIRRSLVALSTATVAADDEGDGIIIIIALIFPSFYNNTVVSACFPRKLNKGTTTSKFSPEKTQPSVWMPRKEEHKQTKPRRKGNSFFCFVSVLSF